MPILKRPDAEIHYEEFGSGYPILIYAAGAMRSAMHMWPQLDGAERPRPWNDWRHVLSDRYRVIAMDQRNAGESRGAVQADHGWHTYAADHLALMDHLGIDKFHVLGVCIGGSFCLKAAEAAPDRVTAAVLQNPVGLHPDYPTHFPDMYVDWTNEVCERQPELDRSAVEAMGLNMWNGNFVFSVSRDFVQNLDLPALVLPGDDKPHPAVIGIEVADTLPGAESLMKWKGPEHFESQRDTVIAFLDRHTP